MSVPSNGAPIKHGGCKRCAFTAQPVLVARLCPGGFADPSPLPGNYALCNGCAEELDRLEKKP